MRKASLLIIACLFGLVAVHAQGYDSLSIHSRQLYSDYLKKRSTFKTVGWVLLGGGVAVFGTAYLVNANNGFNGPTKGENLFTAGLIAAAASTPFFILAGKNSRKAKLVLKTERVSSAIIFPELYYPATAVQFSF